MSDLDKYIEGYCRKHEISREEALTHACVRNATEYYNTRDIDKIETTDTIKAGCGKAV